jgi:hypothetical protein
MARLMSALGQKQTSTSGIAMSALCQKRTWRAAKGMSLFDHFVGDSEYSGRNRKAQRPRGFRVDGQFEFGRLYDGQVTRLFSLDYSPHVNTNVPIRIWKAGSIAHQSAGHDEITQKINGGKCLACG